MQSAAASQRMLVHDPAAKLDLTAWPTAAAPCRRATFAQIALHDRSGMQVNASQPFFTLASATSGPAMVPAAPAAHTRASDSSSHDDLDTTVMRMLSRLAKVRATSSETSMLPATVHAHTSGHPSHATAHISTAVCRTRGSNVELYQTPRRRCAYPAGGRCVPRRQRVRRSIPALKAACACRNTMRFIVTAEMQHPACVGRMTPEPEVP